MLDLADEMGDKDIRIRSKRDGGNPVIAAAKEPSGASFVKDHYFPFLQRFSRYIVIGWLAIFVISVVYGPSFLGNTSSNVSLPSNLPSVKAMNVYNDNYPDSSGAPPVFILYHVSDVTALESIVDSETQDASSDLDNMLGNYDYVTSVSGYWEYINDSSLSPLATSFISPNNLTMLTTISFAKGTSDQSLTKLSNKLISFAESHSTDEIFVGVTGLFPLFTEMQTATASNFETIDITVLPIGLALLGVTIRSYKHVLLALCNLACTVLFAFALMVPVSDAVSINPFSPTIMMSLGIAVCFDYSLFQLNRFKEEMIRKGPAQTSEQNQVNIHDSVIQMLETSGHVVGFSSLILLLTFVILIIFPQQFLRSIGISCACIVFCAAFVNLTLTPSFLLAFSWFSSFQMFPGVSDTAVIYLCCEMFMVNNVKVEDVQSNSIGADAEAGHGMDASGDIVSRGKIVSSLPTSKMTIANRNTSQEKGKWTLLSSLRSFPIKTGYSEANATELNDTSRRSLESIVERPQSSRVARTYSVWFRMTVFVIRFRVVLLTITAVLTGLLLWRVLTMVSVLIVPTLFR
jgi:hypothetical protein